MKYFIKTFGCAQNEADSERITAMYQSRGMKKAKTIYDADYVVINSCMVREMAENRVYGLIYNLKKGKLSRKGCVKPKARKIILTGCMAGMAIRDKSGKFLRLMRKKMPDIDEFLPIEEVGFENIPVRTDNFHALVPVSNGCNNFCTYCVVPYSRGREVSRPFEEVIKECKQLAGEGYKKITLLGMNVNSYGADLILGQDNVQMLRDTDMKYFRSIKPRRESGYEGVIPIKQYSKIQPKTIKNSYKNPVYVKHLGRFRIPTLFPNLLEDICKIEELEFIDFMSSNPWDFSDELIEVITKNSKITRDIHLPVQSGSDNVLKRMNRWYTAWEYLDLISKLRSRISNIKISTDIIVGFCGETEKEFQETYNLAKKAKFSKAYIALYSDRPLTTAHKVLKDDVPFKEKKRRWLILEDLINKPNFIRKA
jgi:tRNA-2-methylthio-N6-dimethylallyladenosine synthase